MDMVRSIMGRLSRLNAKYLSLPFLARLVIAGMGVSFVLICSQNLQFFPGASLALFNEKMRDPGTLPVGVESIFVDTVDGERLEMWRLGVTEPRAVAVVFHGNAADVANFFPYQLFLKDLGITSYGFDYRGYGNSTGWPTEKGLYADGRAVLDYALKREGIDASQLIIVGISIGSGPAARVAREFEVGSLVFFSPFLSLQEAVRATPLFGFLHPFTMYDFPVAEDVARLGATCVIIAHGRRDNVIPFEQGEELYKRTKDARTTYFIPSGEASHNNQLHFSREEISEKILSCISEKHVKLQRTQSGAGSSLPATTHPGWRNYHQRASLFTLLVPPSGCALSH